MTMIPKNKIVVTYLRREHCQEIDPEDHIGSDGYMDCFRPGFYSPGPVCLGLKFSRSIERIFVSGMLHVEST